MNYALILAGGSGKRFAASIASDTEDCAREASDLYSLSLNTDFPKQFIQINGKAIICYTLDRFEACNLIDKIIVVCNPDYSNKLQELLSKYSYTKIDKIVNGGSSQWGSVFNGLRYIHDELFFDEDDIVTVHGACCPLVTDKIIKDSIKVAKEYGASAASPSTSTTTWLVDTETEYAEHSLQNCHVKQVQYPFSYKLDILYSSLKSYIEEISYAQQKGRNNTKFASKFKRNDLHPVLNAGHKIYFSQGSYSNIKITTKDDFEFAKNVLTV